MWENQRFSLVLCIRNRCFLGTGTWRSAGPRGPGNGGAPVPLRILACRHDLTSLGTQSGPKDSHRARKITKVDATGPKDLKNGGMWVPKWPTVTKKEAPCVKFKCYRRLLALFRALSPKGSSGGGESYGVNPPRTEPGAQLRSGRRNWRGSRGDTPWRGAQRPSLAGYSV